jgi:hypothetical protein
LLQIIKKMCGKSFKNVDYIDCKIVAGFFFLAACSLIASKINPVRQPFGKK